MENKLCAHLEAISPSEVKKAQVQECAECIKTNSTWVNLRTCQECGITHCCDSSPNKHATAHFKETGHPVMTSSLGEERWMWCFADEKTLEY